MITVGKTYRFEYPKEFVTLPEYTQHAGQVVTVISLYQEGNEDEEAMWKMQATDGWVGEAFESELMEVAQ